VAYIACAIYGLSGLPQALDEDSDQLHDVHRGHAPDPGEVRLSSHSRIHHETNQVLEAFVDVPEAPVTEGFTWPNLAASPTPSCAGVRFPPFPAALPRAHKCRSLRHLFR